MLRARQLASQGCESMGKGYVMKVTICCLAILTFIASCTGTRDSSASLKTDSLCMDCYFLGTYPLDSYFTTRLSKRDSSFYFAHARDTDQVRLHRVVELLDQCQEVHQADPSRIHTFCIISQSGREIGRIGIPPTQIDTPSTIGLYWQDHYCNCQWEAFPQVIQGFEPLYRDTIIDYIRGGTLRRREE